MAIEMRECRACGGTGCESGRAHGLPVHSCPVCPVCLGTGTVEAKPSVRDAMADAEALHLTAGNYDTLTAGRAGLLSVSEEHQGDPFYVDTENRVWRAREAARAAFRAIPALGGE